MIVGTHGVNLDFVVGLSLDGLTMARIVFVSPSKKRFVGTAFVTDPVRGVVRYIVQSELFDRPGTYEVQVWLEFGTSKLMKSEPMSLEVERSL